MRNEVGLVSFKLEQTKEILDVLSIKTQKIGEIDVILNEMGQIAKCEICNKELSTKNLGNVANGSNLLFCDNSACFISHLVKKNY